MIRQGLPVVLSRWLRRGLSVAIVCCVAYLWVRYGLEKIPEDFAALEPVVSAGARIIVDKRYQWGRDVRKGDIVLFSVQWGGRQRTGLSQVVGVPGDKIVVYSGQLTINDRVVEEGSARAKDCELALDKGSYYLLNPDRSFPSADSRELMAIDESTFRARLLTVLPF